MTVKLKSLLERKIQNSIHREINEIKPVGGRYSRILSRDPK